MIKTIGDYWRSCSDEELATNLLEFLVTLLVNAGISEDQINFAAEHAILVDFFGTEYGELEEEPDSSNGYSYLN